MSEEAPAVGAKPSGTPGFRYARSGLHRRADPPSIRCSPDIGRRPKSGDPGASRHNARHTAVASTGAEERGPHTPGRFRVCGAPVTQVWPDPVFPGRAELRHLPGLDRQMYTFVLLQIADHGE